MVYKKYQLPTKPGGQLFNSAGPWQKDDAIIIHTNNSPFFKIYMNAIWITFLFKMMVRNNILAHMQLVTELNRLCLLQYFWCMVRGGG